MTVTVALVAISQAELAICTIASTGTLVVHFPPHHHLCRVLHPSFIAEDALIIHHVGLAVQAGACANNVPIPWSLIAKVPELMARSRKCIEHR